MTDRTTEFPGLATRTYLDSCAHGLLPRRTRRAIETHLDRWEGDPNWDEWNAAIERARSAFARLIGARPEEIAIGQSASTGTSAIMSTFRKGRIVTLDIDFPTSGHIAERQTERGLEHEHLSMGLVKADAWAPRIKGAALACLPAVASFTGYRLDVGAFAARAHERDVPVLVDAFQACGTYPMDVRRLDVDFLVTGVYKWLLGPVGLAFAYVRPDHHARVPSVGGWYAQETPYAFDPLGPLARDARRFQFGGVSILGCVAFAESAALLQEVGIANIERHNVALVERIMDRARERKWEILTPEPREERASIVTFKVPDLDRALDACRREGISINSRLGGIRESPHFYNTAADVDRMFEVLDRAS